MAKKKVPQVGKTGVSHDYANAFAFVIMFWSKSGVVGVAEMLRAYKVKKYTERFPPDEYKNVITPQNFRKVKRINQLAEKLNTMTDPRLFTRLEFITFYNELVNLIYGDKSHRIK